MKNEKHDNPNIKRAVIYCRVSTKEQADEGNSLVSQERICREYAIKEGYEIAEVFIEKGESAKTAERTELKRMLSFCTAKKGNAHAVIAYKVDRISRNIADYTQIRLLLKKFHVDIKSVTEYFEDTPAGRFMENIIANVGQFDNDVRAERSLGGMREATQEGRYVWTAPLGYSNVKVNGKSTIAKNEMAPLIKEVFEQIALKIDSTELIRLKMFPKGLTNKKGKPVTRSNFFHLLRNPLYKGIIKKFGRYYHGTFDPIVSEDLFDTVQAILEGRKNKVKYYLHDNPDFPLRRFVLSENGKQLTGYWSKGKKLKYPYYSFHAAGTTIRKEVLEQKFMDFLDKYAFDHQHIHFLKDSLIKHFHKEEKENRNNTENIEKRIIEINGKIDKLIELEDKGSISTTMMADRIKKFEEELSELKVMIKEREPFEVDIPDLFSYVTEALKNPGKLWLKSSLEDKKRMQVFDFPEGVVFDGKNFRTPKICRLFKLKEQIEGLKLPGVSSASNGKNTLAKTILPPYSKKVNCVEISWECVAKDLRLLKRIIQEGNREA